MFDSAIYKNRRQALRNKVQNGLILILCLLYTSDAADD